MLALGPSCVPPGAAAQPRMVSVVRIRLDSHKSMRPFKGIIATTFLSSNPITSATQSGLCEPRTVSLPLMIENLRPAYAGYVAAVEAVRAPDHRADDMVCASSIRRTRRAGTINLVTNKNDAEREGDDVVHAAVNAQHLLRRSQTAERMPAGPRTVHILDFSTRGSLLPQATYLQGHEPPFRDILTSAAKPRSACGISAASSLPTQSKCGRSGCTRNS
jgi:hypothetical protein